jgi:hypothetical protein
LRRFPCNAPLRNSARKTRDAAQGGCFHPAAPPALNVLRVLPRALGARQNRCGHPREHRAAASVERHGQHSMVIWGTFARRRRGCAPLFALYVNFPEVLAQSPESRGATATE